MGGNIVVVAVAKKGNKIIDDFTIITIKNKSEEI
jgi:hypothetical protein